MNKICSRRLPRSLWLSLTQQRFRIIAQMHIVITSVVQFQNNCSTLKNRARTDEDSNTLDRRAAKPPNCKPLLLFKQARTNTRAHPMGILFGPCLQARMPLIAKNGVHVPPDLRGSLRRRLLRKRECTWKCVPSRPGPRRGRGLPSTCMAPGPSASAPRSFRCATPSLTDSDPCGRTSPPNILQPS